MFLKNFKKTNSLTDAEIQAEITILKDVLKVHRIPYTIPSDLSKLSDQRTWLISQLKWVPASQSLILQEASDEIYRLKKELREKEKEIKTLKNIIGFTEVSKL